MELKIKKLAKLENGIVIKVNWVAYLIDGEHKVEHEWHSIFNRKEIDETFIPFESLTENQVKQWVLDSMPEEIELILAGKMQARKNPSPQVIHLETFPWDNNK